MKKYCIDLEKTGQFSSFFLDYIKGKESLRPFYTHLPRLESFEDAIKAKAFPESSRKTLHNALLEQYQSLTIKDEVQSNLDALLDGKTFTVTTGHQLNLFTGPLYFIYKIVSTINLARKLKDEFPDYHFVPVYWMAAEDHDFDEINYFKLDGKKYQWNSNQTGAVGDFELDQSFRDWMKEIHFAPEVFKEAYLKSKTLAEAVRKYVDGLFGDEGLVVVDGNHSGLKWEFASVIEDDLFYHSAFQQASDYTQRLEDLGYKSQIYPREINFFYLEKGIRERIELVGEEYRVLNTEISFSPKEMKDLIQAHPERFSPNVVLRPLYQEIILPNLAYLGGPAEVVYWLQLKGVFDHFQIPFPVLLPRNFGLILDSVASRKMNQLGWSVEDLFSDFSSWKKSYVEAHASVDFNMDEQKRQVIELFQKKGNEAEGLEKSLKSAFDAAQVRSLKILDHLGGKLRKAEERRQEVVLARAKAVLDFAASGGVPQERTVNFMQFYLENPKLISELMENFDPLEFKLFVLQYE
ncbi:bacillithiol biosynthesis cysteine-adding enzyme BshC [Algoriphagus taiwanensis]|uniref:Putative cysteine ligase BshC n=1 Tax=Algoriphagus taiwanensis TaxID=1445656 RepID=A0ABQ6Q410_9BACT|nr:bacillithiol biosynthesis cysteine-adding enzyme BshC [Algoriphagus taiwanensis]